MVKKVWKPLLLTTVATSDYDILRNVYGHVVIAVDQSHTFRIFHSAFYWHPSFKGIDDGSIYHPLVQLIYSYSKASTQLHKQRHKTNSRVECQANTQSIKQKPTWNHNLVTHILLTYTDIIKANVSIRKAILTNYSLHIWKYRKNNMLTLVHTLTTLSDSNDY